jgi:hypothetical protein
MDTLIGLGVVLLVLGLFAALLASIRRAQREDNRNSAIGQSSYVVTPPNGEG